MNFFRDIFDNPRRTSGALALVLLAGACGLPPEVEQFANARAERVVSLGYPALLPASYFDTPVIVSRDTSDMVARVAALRRRMVALTGPVIPPADMARLQAALARH